MLNRPSFFVEKALSEEGTQGAFSNIASLDLSNAFKSTAREAIAGAINAPALCRAVAWAYNKPALLGTEEGSFLASLKGVRHGDPFEPLFFSLALWPTLDSLA